MLLSMLSYGAVTGGEYGIIPEYALNYSGTIFGVANTLASTLGFVCPLIVGLLLDHGEGSGARHQWNIMWYMAGAVYAFGGLVFEVLGTAEPQPWALIIDTNSSPQDMKLSVISNDN
ncbi:unnamed protein product [Oppiella nova]|uniref:Major facilitator superfamily (MFS) profile domain-containing protein n=1 Tax=Oppiella nova TaxID=334625 RepID=A0A7R9M613_9ACAR|nr:unnamed protein product [Oppiella nova]CAG2171314.1 unnamed protein product [Oppiella nova]